MAGDLADASGEALRNPPLRQNMTHFLIIKEESEKLSSSDNISNLLLSSLQVLGFEHILYRHSDIFLEAFAEMIAAYRQINNIGEVAGTVEKRPEEQFPVITPASINDAHIPHRAEKAEKLIKVWHSLYL